PRGFDADEAPDHVVEHCLGLALQGIAVAAAARGQDGDGVLGPELHHIDLAELLLVLAAAVLDGARGRPAAAAGEAPGLEAEAVHAAAQHMGPGAVRREGELEPAPAAPATGTA